MSTPANTDRTWRFGVFEVDTRRAELRRGGAPVKMREQSFRILVYLLEHAGEIVTREELRRVLWPSDTFVDFDHSLNTAVMKLRDALGSLTTAAPRILPEPTEAGSISIGTTTRNALLRLRYPGERSRRCQWRCSLPEIRDVSPDGSSLLVSSHEGGQGSLWTVQVQEGLAPSPAHILFWGQSPSLVP